MSRESTDYIMIHCSATRADMDIGAADIDRWHRQRGWRRIGYHYVIRRNGEVETGRGMDAVGAHCKGMNDKSVSICLVGGLDEHNKAENNFTKEQWETLEKLVWQCKLPYADAEVVGHNEFSDKECPCFDVREWWSTKKATS